MRKGKNHPRALFPLSLASYKVDGGTKRLLRRREAVTLSVLLSQGGGGSSGILVTGMCE